MNKGKIIALILTFCMSFSAVAMAAELPPSDVGEGVAAWDNPFVDVSVEDWFFRSIEYAYTEKLFSGTEADKFSPNKPLTRAMLVTVLGRMSGENVSGYESPGFTDVDGEAYYSDYVSWAYASGIVTGVSEGLFAPDRDISRQDLAVMLLRYAKYAGLESFAMNEKAAFTDASDISEYAAEAVTAMQIAGVINGKPNGAFDSHGTASRAETATMLHRFAILFSDPALAVE
jgi:S-layer homology domain.